MASMYWGYHLPKLPKPEHAGKISEADQIRRALAVLERNDEAVIESTSWPIGEFEIKHIRIRVSTIPDYREPNNDDFSERYAAVRGLFAIHLIDWCGVSRKRYRLTHLPTGLAATSRLTIEEAVALIKALDNLKLDWTFDTQAGLTHSHALEFLAIKKEAIGSD